MQNPPLRVYVYDLLSEINKKSLGEALKLTGCDNIRFEYFKIFLALN